MTLSAPNTKAAHFDALDGWRGISILLVLAGHLFPLGPKSLDLNGAVAGMGMAIFFTLSGFLITSFLIRRPEVGAFLTRRFFRIVPLAWAACALALAVQGASAQQWAAHALFYGNLPPFYLTDLTAHIWSLCLEMQFYVGVALIVAVLGSRGLLLLPVLCVLVTAARIVAREPMSIVTWFRIDEILAGCTVALIVHRQAGSRLARFIARVPAPVTLLALLAACHPRAEPLNYLRPYFASAAVASTLLNPHTRLARALGHKALAYVAQISYALYVLHPLLAHTWLGTGDVLARYAKRPLLMLALFASAHVSTFQFERRFIDLGHRLSSGRRRKAIV